MVKPGYKQTEIGVLPEDWKIATLEDLYSITSSKRVFQSEWRDSGVPFYRAREIAVMGEGLSAPKDLYISDEMYDRYSKQYGEIKENDVLITGVGTLGKVYVVKKDDKFYFKDGNIIWLQWNGQYSSQFLKHLYRTTALTDQVFGNAGGSTVPTYTITNAKATIVPCPDYAEQCEIADVLSEIDALIATTEKQFTKKKAIKQGAMQELLTGKKRLPGFRKKWTTKIIPDILQKQVGIKIGPFGSQLKKEYLLDNGPYRVYGQENVYVRNFSIGNRYLSRERFAQLQSCEIKAGDFLISTMGTIGKCAIVPAGIHKGIMDSHLIRLRIDNTIMLPEYLLHLFSEELGYLRTQTSKLSVGGIMEGLSTKIVNSLVVRYPEDINEQKAIAEILSNMDSEIEALEQKLVKYRHVKQGMMQQLLTGKIRLV